VGRNPIIKWTGSKRYLAKEIINVFPEEIDTYYEPFVGGGSIMFALLNSSIKVNNIVCSDICKPLIDLWHVIKSEPNKLFDFYVEKWKEFKEDKNIYYDIRNSFNKTKSPYDFFFLNRTSYNGLVRFNKKGWFNVSVHYSRDGIKPSNIYEILMEWCDKLNRYEVTFLNIPFNNIKTCSDNDFFYFDPPYEKSSSLYFGDMDHQKFWNWLKGINCGYVLSFGDGELVPYELYDKKVSVLRGQSSFTRLQNNPKKVSEKLYIKYK